MTKISSWTNLNAEMQRRRVFFISDLRFFKCRINMSEYLALALFTILSFSINHPTNEIWLNDVEVALQQSKIQEKPILLVFSGSDWCKPCIRLDQRVFQDEVFQAFAKENLILLKADFPRKRKNRLSKNLQSHNEKLAEKYNPNGFFPYAVLLDKNGKITKIINTEAENASQFIHQIK